MTRLLLLLILLSSVALAGDGGSDEAQFTNNSAFDLYCYGDAGGTDYICQVKVGPGETCRGDAMGGAINSPIFKAPNKTKWKCDLDEKKAVTCSALDRKSSAVTAAAFTYHRFKGYYSMEWNDFMAIMGSKHLRGCDKDYKATTNEIWAPAGEACLP